MFFENLFQKTLNTQDENIDRLIDRHTQYIESLNNLNKLTELLQQRNKALQQELQEQNEALQKELAEKNKNAQEILHLQQELENTKNTHSQEKTEIQNQLTTAQEEKAALTKQIEDKENEITAMRTNVENMKWEIALEMYNEKKESLEEHINTLTNLLTSVVKNKYDNNPELKTKAQYIFNLQKEVNELTNKLNNKKSSDVVRSVFQNGAMIEGWAVYAESMMLEEGWGNNSPEMELVHHKLKLRELANVIIDYDLQVLNKSKEDLIHLMVDECFQTNAQAEEKYHRATVSQVQLCSYYAGSTAIQALREEYKKKLGDKYRLKDFHETFLSFGSSPVKYIREIMLQ